MKNKLSFLFYPIPFIFYWYTCLPSIGLGDSVLFIHAIKRLEIKTWVNNHNMTALWGWLFQFLPWGDIAYRGNLSCAFAVAIAVCIFYRAVYKAHQSLAVAMIASLFLMVSHSLWWHATDLADYAMNAVFTSVAIYLYVQLHNTNHEKYLYAIFFVAGLAIFQHYLLGSLLIGATAAFLFRCLSHKDQAWALTWKSLMFFIIGLLPWLITFSNDISISHSFTQTLSGCLGGPFKKLFFQQPLWKGITEYLFLVFMQFPSLYILPVTASLFYFFKKWSWNACSIGLLFSFLPIVYFDLGLDSWAVFAQLLPTFIILAFWASFSIDKLYGYLKAKGSVLFIGLSVLLSALSLVWTIYFYAHLSIWGENPNSIWYPRFNNSYTPNCYRLNEFLANPNKRHYHDISQFCHLLLEKLPANAQYWDSDSRLFFQTKEYYQQYYHLRPDLNIQLINSFGFANWGSDKNTFEQMLKFAYQNDRSLFLCSTGHPFNTLIANLPYKFNKYPLDESHWVYKLQTISESSHEQSSSKGRWDYLATDRPSLINLTMDNVLDFHEGTVIFQQDMSNFGSYWRNDDQIFFNPQRIGSQIGFLLRFEKPLRANLSISLTTAFDAGLVEVYMNNLPLTKEAIDLYSIGVSKKQFDFENVEFSSGNNILTIRIIGKNEQSKDMKLGVDTIEIRPLK